MASYKTIKNSVFGNSGNSPRTYSSTSEFPVTKVAGDIAYLDSDGAGGTDSLYVSDGGGWYRISFDSSS
tara:strand:- start:1279 stop:1485 length:207 start_codon:yes stop_codon:yes gene_type:complete